MAARNIDSLTALRGIAAYLVVLSHCRRVIELQYFGEPTWSSVLRLLDAGTFGVVLFFVLSGCTLYLSYGDQPTTPEFVARFSVRRFFRVYPAFFVSFFVYALLDAVVRNRVGFPADTWIATFGKVPDGPIIAEYLSFSFNFFGHWDFFNNAYWSLPVEFQFYLLFPIFVLLLRIGPFALAAGALFLFVVSSLLHLHFLTFMLAWQFAVGIGAGWLLLRRRLQLPSHTLLLGCAVLLAVAVGVSFFHKRLYYPPGVSDWTYLGLLAFPIVYLAAQISRPTGRFGRTLFRFAVSEGEASYSVYLYHNVFVLLAYVLIVRLQLTGPMREAVVYILVFAGTYAASHLSFRFIERPGIALGRRLSTAIGSRRAPA